MLEDRNNKVYCNSFVNGDALCRRWRHVTCNCSIFADIDECFNNPCMHEAYSCKNTFGSYECNCASNYTGIHCQIGKLLLLLSNLNRYRIAMFWKRRKLSIKLCIPISSLLSPVNLVYGLHCFHGDFNISGQFLASLQFQSNTKLFCPLNVNVYKPPLYFTAGRNICLNLITLEPWLIKALPILPIYNGQFTTAN